MIKLNNKGWGLAAMLIYLGILLLALLVVVIMSRQFDHTINLSIYI